MSIDINKLLSDPCASNWLKRATRELLDRDPVDAYHDAQTLAQIAKEQCDKVFNSNK